MGVIGIITCEILELEFAHMLALDRDLEKATILENALSTRLIEALASRNCPNLQRIPHIGSFLPDPAARLEVVVRVLEVALHRNKKILQNALKKAAHELAGKVDALLLGYGLCGNALENVAELLDVRVPVFIPMDHDHPVDDCVGLLIGGRDCYYAEQCKTPGTVFMIPGFTNHLNKILQRDPQDTEYCGVKRMFKGYERALLIVTPVMSEEEMGKNSSDFNRLLELRSEVRRGTLEILHDTWLSAKKYMADSGNRTIPRQAK